ncbi:MAG TPA: dTMP kinase [Thermoplasmata archaeon]|nr:dTMP kinase [Thermoplasmata archaeon]
MLSGFVTFEGIDGSGKTTVSRSVADALRSRGQAVFLTGEPTTSWLGDAVRRAYDDDVGPIAESFLFLADRAAHLAEIRAHLAQSEVVLCDRYADSTYAYQGARLEGVVADPIAFLRRASEPWLLLPDLTILLRIPPDLAATRIAPRGNPIRLEDPELLRRVAANYERLASDPRIAVVDATRPLGDVVTHSIQLIEGRLARVRAR